MGAPAATSLSVEQLDAMATARKKKLAAASSAQAEATDDETEGGDPKRPQGVRALAVPPPTPTVPHAVNAVPNVAQRLEQVRKRLVGERTGNLPRLGHQHDTVATADRGAHGAESGPPSGEKRKATSAGGSPPEPEGKPKKSQMKSGKVDQILKE